MLSIIVMCVCIINPIKVSSLSFVSIIPNIHGSARFRSSSLIKPTLAFRKYKYAHHYHPNSRHLTVTQTQISPTSHTTTTTSTNHTPTNIHQNDHVQHIMKGRIGVTSVVCVKPTIATINDINNDDDTYTKIRVQQQSTQSTSSSLNHTIYIGTTRGKLHEISIPIQSSLSSSSSSYIPNQNGNNNIEDSKYYLSSVSLSKPYPIYSMDVVDLNLHSNKDYSDDNDYKNDRRMILCGGGDRFVTIWEKEKVNNTNHRDTKNDSNNDEDDSNDDKWSDHTRLGPHTGWVKDVVYDHANEFIYCHYYA